MVLSDLYRAVKMGRGYHFSSCTAHTMQFKYLSRESSFFSSDKLKVSSGFY